jgi:hypothetical protein
MLRRETKILYAAPITGLYGTARRNTRISQPLLKTSKVCATLIIWQAASQQLNA